MNITNLISALIVVESGAGGNDMAVGDNGKALGALQIHQGVVLDVNRFTGSRHRWEDMTNRALARKVCQSYLERYGRGATAEQLARRWNGGPQGDRKSATLPYWRKVEAALRKVEAK